MESVTSIRVCLVLIRLILLRWSLRASAYEQDCVYTNDVAAVGVKTAVCRVKCWYPSRREKREPRKHMLTFGAVVEWCSTHPDL